MHGSIIMKFIVLYAIITEGRVFSIFYNMDEAGERYA